MSKRPFFLLEILIAMVLIGFFSVYFLGAAYRHFSHEEKALLELEFQRAQDLERMKILSSHWKSGEALLKESKEVPYTLTVQLGKNTYKRSQKCTVWCSGKKGNSYKLKMREGKRVYHFVIEDDKM